MLWREADYALLSAMHCITIGYIERGPDMQSQFTVRLADDLERGIANYAKKLHLKRSDVVRMALQKFMKETPISEDQSPYERVSNLIGTVESGIPDLGQSHRKHILEKIKKRA